jgi:protein phosphatase PTC7
LREAVSRNLVDIVARGSSKLSQAEEAKKVIDAFFRQSAHMIPHYEKRHKGGEDAYVSNERLLVVADGVGGWAEVGIDPGLFSKQLVKDIEAEFNKNPKGSLKEMLVQAVKLNRHIGSSTAVLSTMDVVDGSVILRTTNLGDSGYVIFRAPSFGSQSQDKL